MPATNVLTCPAPARAGRRKVATGPSQRNVPTGPGRRVRSCRSDDPSLRSTQPCPVGVTVARYYDPSTAQFLTRDPLDAETGQPYAYADDDPLDGSDPSGLCNANPFSGSFWSSGNCLSDNTPSWVPIAGQVKSFAACSGAGGTSVYDCGVMNLDPAYLAIDGYYSEWQDSEHGCSLSTIAGDGLEAVEGVAGTASLAVGGAARINSNNLVRWGPAYKDGPNRLSLGAQTKYWQQMPRWRQVLQPFHVHMEVEKGGITYNPSGKSVGLWGPSN